MAPSYKKRAKGQGVRRLRRQNTEARSYRRKFLIVVEGQTEENYFNSFRGEYNVSVHVCRGAGGTEPENLLTTMSQIIEEEKAQSRLKSGDRAWLVLDRDGRPDNRLSVLFDWASERKDRGVAFTDPQFEWWLLLHYEDGTGVSTKNECLATINRHIPDYRKARSDQLPKSDGQRADAVRRARQRVPNYPTSIDDLTDVGGALTTVHFLVEDLLEAKQKSSAV